VYILEQFGEEFGRFAEGSDKILVLERGWYYAIGDGYGEEHTWTDRAELRDNILRVK
jgi:hypothetical protein